MNEKYYFEKYPDVNAAGLRASEHYLKYGWKEHRYANSLQESLHKYYQSATVGFVSCFFMDEGFYLSSYPDVAASGMPPRLHYRQHGAAEGRHPNRLFSVFSAAIFFLRNEKKHSSSGDGSDEPLIGEYRRMIFDAAHRGEFPRIRVWATRRQMKQRRPAEKLLIAQFPVCAIWQDKSPDCTITSIEPSEPFSFHEPEIINSSRSRPLRTIELPEKWLATVDNATVIGGFQVLAGGKFMLYEPAANPLAGFVAGIWPYVAPFGNRREILAWFRYTSKTFLPEAILLSGRCSPNYYHWLIEYLGKAYILSKCGNLPKIPLIIDEAMFPQEFESLQVILPDWPTFKVSKSTLLKVRKLHIPSIHTNLADNLREPMWKTSAICFRTLSCLRTKAFEKFGIVDGKARGERKIFLARRHGRNILNTSEIENTVAALGYEIVDSSELSFEDQVRLFSEAKILVGAMGAAFTNLIFCRPGARVLALSSPYTQLFCSQSNMAMFAGCDYRILVGNHPRFSAGDEETVSDPSLFLDSYSVDIAELVNALQRMESA